MDSVLFRSSEGLSTAVIVRKRVPENGHRMWKNPDLGNSE